MRTLVATLFAAMYTSVDALTREHTEPDQYAECIFTMNLDYNGDGEYTAPLDAIAVFKFEGGGSETLVVDYGFEGGLERNVYVLSIFV